MTSNNSLKFGLHFTERYVYVYVCVCVYMCVCVCIMQNVHKFCS